MSSNFIQNVRINNLEKQLNTLQAQLASLSGGQQIADLDLNNHNIKEVNGIIFNNSTNGTNAQITGDQYYAYYNNRRVLVAGNNLELSGGYIYDSGNIALRSGTKLTFGTDPSTPALAMDSNNNLTFNNNPVLIGGDDVDLDGQNITNAGDISLSDGKTITLNSGVVGNDPSKAVVLGSSYFNLWGPGIATINGNEKVITSGNWGSILPEIGNLPLSGMTLQYDSLLNCCGISSENLVGGSLMPYNVIFNIPINQPSGAYQQLCEIKLPTISGSTIVYIIRGFVVTSDNDTFNYECSVSVSGTSFITILGQNETLVGTSGIDRAVSYSPNNTDFTLLGVNLSINTNEGFLGTGYDATIYYQVFPQRVEAS
jgi:hypothetical protein